MKLSRVRITLGQSFGSVTVFAVLLVLTGCGMQAGAAAPAVATGTAVPAPTKAATPTLAVQPSATTSPRTTATPGPTDTATPVLAELVLRWDKALVTDSDDVHDIVLRLKNTPGIVDGSGNEIEIHILYDPAVITPDQIQQALSDLGYNTTR